MNIISYLFLCLIRSPITQGLEYCEERYSQELSGSAFPLRAQATNTRLLSCQTIEKFRPHPDRDDSMNEGKPASPDTMCEEQSVGNNLAYLVASLNSSTNVWRYLNSSRFVMEDTPFPDILTCFNFFTLLCTFSCIS